MYLLIPVHCTLNTEYWEIFTKYCMWSDFIYHLPTMHNKMLMSFQFINNNSPLGSSIDSRSPFKCWITVFGFSRDAFKFHFIMLPFAYVRPLICKCWCIRTNQPAHATCSECKRGSTQKATNTRNIKQSSSRRNKFKSRKTQQCVISINLKESITFVHISLFSLFSFVCRSLVLAYSICVLIRFRLWVRFGRLISWTMSSVSNFSFNIKLLRTSAAFDIFSFGV